MTSLIENLHQFRRYNGERTHAETDRRTDNPKT